MSCGGLKKGRRKEKNKKGKKRKERKVGARGKRKESAQKETEAFIQELNQHPDKFKNECASSATWCKNSVKEVQKASREQQTCWGGCVC